MGEAVLRGARTAALLAIVAGVAAVSTRAGPDYGFALFYLIPVVAGAIWVGRSESLLVAVVAAVFWLAVDRSLHPTTAHVLPSLWNGFTRLVIFAGAALLVGSAWRAHQRTRELAFSDELTGLHNRRYLDEEASRLDAVAARHARRYSVIALDVDGLKSVNDARGHGEGDRLLRTAGAHIRSSVRREDVSVRLGGDEFAVLLPETEEGEAALIADRIVDGPVRLSAGVATWKPGAEFASVLAEADRALYTAKSDGGRRVGTPA